jgi:hypothetical protein
MSVPVVQLKTRAGANNDLVTASNSPSAEEGRS